MAGATDVSGRGAGWRARRDGVDLGRFDNELADCLMIAVTEKRTKQEIDKLVEKLKGYSK